MQNKHAIRIRLFAFLAIALLLFGATAGSFFHTHESSAAADHCQFCHISHLPAIQSPVVADAQPMLQVVGIAASEHQPQILSAAFAHRSPRAPPAES